MNDNIIIECKIRYYENIKDRLIRINNIEYIESHMNIINSLINKEITPINTTKNLIFCKPWIKLHKTQKLVKIREYLKEKLINENPKNISFSNIEYDEINGKIININI